VRILATVLCVVLFASFGGCDDRPHVEQASAPRPQPAAKSWPTTREFLAMPRKPTPLVYMPLTVSIPDGWKLDPPDAPTSLDGPAPSGDLEISISILAPMKTDRVNLLVQGAHQEAVSQQGLVVHDLPPINGLKALEKISHADLSAEPTTLPSVAVNVDPPGGLSATMAAATVRNAGVPGEQTSPTTLPAANQRSAAATAGETVSWNVIVFVPYQGKFVPCSFDLIGLTPEQFAADESFVRSMLNSAVPTKDIDPATF
jgi:hypothetical protein